MSAKQLKQDREKIQRDNRRRLVRARLRANPLLDVCADALLLLSGDETQYPELFAKANDKQQEDQRYMPRLEQLADALVELANAKEPDAGGQPPIKQRDPVTSNDGDGATDIEDAERAAIAQGYFYVPNGVASMPDYSDATHEVRYDLPGLGKQTWVRKRRDGGDTKATGGAGSGASAPIAPPVAARPPDRTKPLTSEKGVAIADSQDDRPPVTTTFADLDATIDKTDLSKNRIVITDKQLPGLIDVQTKHRDLHLDCDGAVANDSEELKFERGADGMWHALASRPISMFDSRADDGAYCWEEEFRPGTEYEPGSPVVMNEHPMTYVESAGQLQQGRFLLVPGAIKDDEHDRSKKHWHGCKVTMKEKPDGAVYVGHTRGGMSYWSEETDLAVDIQMDWRHAKISHTEFWRRFEALTTLDANIKLSNVEVLNAVGQYDSAAIGSRTHLARGFTYDNVHAKRPKGHGLEFANVCEVYRSSVLRAGGNGAYALGGQLHIEDFNASEGGASRHNLWHGLSGIKCFGATPQKTVKMIGVIMRDNWGNDIWFDMYDLVNWIELIDCQSHKAGRDGYHIEMTPNVSLINCIAKGSAWIEDLKDKAHGVAVRFITSPNGTVSGGVYDQILGTSHTNIGTMENWVNGVHKGNKDVEPGDRTEWKYRRAFMESPDLSPFTYNLQVKGAEILNPRLSMMLKTGLYRQKTGLLDDLKGRRYAYKNGQPHNMITDNPEWEDCHIHHHEASKEQFCLGALSDTKSPFMGGDEFVKRHTTGAKTRVSLN